MINLSPSCRQRHWIVLLALLPPFATMIGRRWGVLRSPGLGLAATRFVALDRTFNPFPHQRQLDQVIRPRPDRFIPLAELPLRRGRRTFPDGLAVCDVLPGTGGAAVAPSIRQVPG
jgi:hypothetical protein